MTWKHPSVKQQQLTTRLFRRKMLRSDQGGYFRQPLTTQFLKGREVDTRKGTVLLAFFCIEFARNQLSTFTAGWKFILASLRYWQSM
mmetsp:Transcript_23741/g.38688  ORF Transcript_23741/g.38688 Transcript_23741/m.38688 type:complete len:87 (-) Transcript_23741:42-302(-)